MPAQGELRGPKARQTGGDWDANADDFKAWVEPEPGEQCKAFIFGEHSLLEGELYPHELEGSIGGHCRNMAPVGASICTPCHRRRIRVRFKRSSLDHRMRISAQTGKKLCDIQ